MLAIVTWLAVLAPTSPVRVLTVARRRTTSVDLAVAAFVVLTLVAFAFTTERHQSLFGERFQHQGVLTLLMYVGFFALARTLVRDVRRLRQVLAGVVVGATVVAAYAIVQASGLDPIWGPDVPGGRVFSTIGQPNALAAYLVLALPITLVFVLRRSGAIRWAAIAVAAVLLAAIGLTLSRGGYIGLAATTPILGWAAVRNHRPSRRLVAAGSGLLVVGALMVAIVPDGRAAIVRVWDRAASSAQTTADLSVRSHLDEWRVAARITADHPLLGTGPETFPDEFPRYSRVVLAPERVRYFDQFRVESPHNELLTVASGTGLPALGAYLALLAAVAVTLVRAARRSADPAVRVMLLAMLAALAGHVVTSSFMSAEITGSWLAWTLMGAAVGLTRPSPPC